MDDKELYIWSSLVELEPMLEKLFIEAANAKGGKFLPSFCANDFWVESSLKFQVGCYAGPEAVTEIQELKSARAYSIAYNVIYNALPPCRKCRCDSKKTEQSFPLQTFGNSKVLTETND